MNIRWRRRRRAGGEKREEGVEEVKEIKDEEGEVEEVSRRDAGRFLKLSGFFFPPSCPWGGVHSLTCSSQCRRGTRAALTPPLPPPAPPPRSQCLRGGCTPGSGAGSSCTAKRKKNKQEVTRAPSPESTPYAHAGTVQLVTIFGHTGISAERLRAPGFSVWL